MKAYVMRNLLGQIGRTGIGRVLVRCKTLELLNGNQIRGEKSSESRKLSATWKRNSEGINVRVFPRLFGSVLRNSVG